MISVLVVLICGVVILIGVIFVIVGLSQRERSRTSSKVAVSVIKKEDKIKMVDNESISSGGKFLSPEIMFDRLMEIQDSPNMVAAFFNTLRGQVYTSLELSLIKRIEEYYKVHASNLRSQADVHKARTEFVQAVTGYEAETDQEMKTLKAKNAKLSVQVEIATKEKQIRELSGEEKKENDEEGKLGKLKKELGYQKERRKVKRELDREERNERIEEDIRDKFDKDTLKQELKEEAFEKYKGKYPRYTIHDINKFVAEDREKLLREWDNIDDKIDHEFDKNF